MKSRPSYDGAYSDHPVTLDMLVPYWGMLAKRALQGMVCHLICIRRRSDSVMPRVSYTLHQLSLH